MVGQVGFFSFGKATGLEEGKLQIQSRCTLLNKMTLCLILLLAEELDK